MQAEAEVLTIHRNTLFAKLEFEGCHKFSLLFPPGHSDVSLGYPSYTFPNSFT